MKITISANDHQVNRNLKTAIRKIKDATSLMKIWGETVVSSVQRNFEEGGRPKKWKESQRAKNQGGQTLVDTARLKWSHTSLARPASVDVGTNVEYAEVHQFGSTITVSVRAHRRKVKGGGTTTVRAHSKKQNILPRPFLMVQDEDWIEIKDSTERYVRKYL